MPASIMITVAERIIILDVFKLFGLFSGSVAVAAALLTGAAFTSGGNWRVVVMFASILCGVNIISQAWDGLLLKKRIISPTKKDNHYTKSDYTHKINNLHYFNKAFRVEFPHFQLKFPNYLLFLQET